MDNFIKVTTGHVRQYYEKNQDGVFVCTGQEFFCSDLCDYEDDGGNPIDPPKYHYQAYDMVQRQSNCKHSFIDKDNEGIYGKECCRFCGVEKPKHNENKTFCECCGRHDCTDVVWREHRGQYECEECYQAFLDC